MENASFEKETEPRRLDVMITGQAGVEEGKRDFEETIGNPLVFHHRARIDFCRQATTLRASLAQELYATLFSWGNLGII